MKQVVLAPDHNPAPLETPTDCDPRRAPTTFGSRSMLTHVAAGADIAVECFARALYNHGVMAAVEV